MKKYTLLFLLMIAAFIMVSWGRTGHSTIALIAENHLTPQARAAVNNFLGGQSLEDVASWADDNRTRETAPWHFINVELGLSFEDFKQQVEGKEDVYTVLQTQEHILTNTAASTADRATALKYIVHFVGDIHQPMHVSRVEDKGGNNIQLRFDGKGTNLHRLWDTNLLEHAGLNPEQLAAKLDHASPEAVKKWQSDPQIVWAWESYRISSQLYGEIDRNGTAIDNAYYEAHLPVVEERIEKAGIRLAGLLNTLLTQPVVAQQVMTIKSADAAQHIGEMVKICEKVYGVKDFGSMTLLNMGAAYPNQLFTVVLRGDARSLEVDGKTICVTGVLVNYRGRPEIVVEEKGEIQ